jgi:hypothetical protein
MFERTAMRLKCYMQSCASREQLRLNTLAGLSRTDWNEEPVVEIDGAQSELPLERQSLLVAKILRRAIAEKAELILLLEDDLIFNENLRHNIRAWYPVRELRDDQHFFASLCNLGVTFDRFVPTLAYGEAPPGSFMGSQALLISRATVRYMMTCWGVEAAVHVDLKLSRLAARVCPLFYHVPSLVQHVGRESTWGGPMLASRDFDRAWKAVVTH